VRLPEPEPGLIFRYDYLWDREARAGRNTSKERPACLAITTDTSEEPRIVIILPITHSKPSGGAVGVEIPENIRRVLHLDDERCWIIVSEANVDEWPNAGIATVPGRAPSLSYGYLPPDFYAAVKKKMLAHLDLRRSVRR
jgi:hypothetical protein